MYFYDYGIRLYLFFKISGWFTENPSLSGLEIVVYFSRNMQMVKNYFNPIETAPTH